MTSTARLLMLLLTTLAYPRGVAGDVTEAELAGAIVGTFLGTLLVCALLATAGYWFCVRKRCQNHEPYKQQRDDAESPNTSRSECWVRSRVFKLHVSAVSQIQIRSKAYSRFVNSYFVNIRRMLDTCTIDKSSYTKYSRSPILTPPTSGPIACNQLKLTPPGRWRETLIAGSVVVCVDNRS